MGISGCGNVHLKSTRTYEGQFVKGQADWPRKLTTQDNIVYEGTFKQGIYQKCELNGFHLVRITEFCCRSLYITWKHFQVAS